MIFLIPNLTPNPNLNPNEEIRIEMGSCYPNN
jgi:hypothetical protein